MDLQDYYKKIHPDRLEDEELIDLKEELIGHLSAGMNGTTDVYINTLCEVERELTLRETN